jgi:uncharacterized lipoprotein YajG
MRKSSFLPTIFFSVLLLAGCSSQPLPVNYAPSSVLTLEGKVTVAEFQYLPAVNNKAIKPNQIRNTALGSAIFEQPIDRMFKEAVFKELRFVGVKLDNPNLTLGGDIEEFLIDDLGYSVDWTLRVKYVVTDKSSGKPVYESVKNIQRKTNKFANVFAALNETIKFNIEELMKDPAFTAVIK